MVSDERSPESTYVAYGVTLLLPRPLIVSTAGRATTSICARVLDADRDEVDARWSGAEREVWRTTLHDGRPLEVILGSAGDHLLRHGEASLVHIDESRTRVTCHAARGWLDPGWQRLLADWLPYLLALLDGGEALHAASVHDGIGVIAFVALSGGGKTTLAAEMVRRGAALVADDIVLLERDEGGIVVQPGPPTLSLDRAGAPAPAAVGSRVAEFGDEQWVEVPNRIDAPTREVRAVILVDRGTYDGVSCEPDASPVISLLAQAVGMPHLTGRDGERFRRYADLAAAASVLRLRASSRTAPHELLNVVESALPQHVAP